MNIEFSLLQALTEAIDTQRETETAAWEAYKRACTIEELPEEEAVAAHIAANTAASHAKHELAAALSAARQHLAAHQ